MHHTHRVTSSPYVPRSPASIVVSHYFACMSFSCALIASRRSERGCSDSGDASAVDFNDVSTTCGDTSKSLSSSRKDLCGSMTSICSAKSQSAATAASSSAHAPASPKPRLTFRAAGQATLTFISARRRVKDWANKKINQHKKNSPEDMQEGSSQRSKVTHSTLKLCRCP